MRTIITFCALAVCSIPVLADTIVLKSGGRIYADSVQERNGRVEYSIGDNTMTIPRSIVVRIETGGSPPPVASNGLEDLAPAEVQLTGPTDVADRIVRNGAVDIAALKSIEDEGIADKSAFANSVAANFEAKHNNAAAAARYLQSALLFSPRQPVLLENYAVILLRLDRAAEALPYAQQAVSANPHSAEAYSVLGWCYYNTDRDREAAQAWKKSLELRPDAKVKDLLDKVERELNAESNFHQQDSNHFTLRYEGRQTPDALRAQILEALENDYRDLSRDFGNLPRNIYVSLYTDETFFDVTRAPAWSAALNDGKIRVPISGTANVTPELARVLRHELTHSFVRQIANGRAPQWLDEGLAQLEEGRTTGAVGGRLASLYGSGNQVPLNQLEGNFTSYSDKEAYVAYAECLAAVEYLRTTFGIDDLARMLRMLGEGQTMEYVLRNTIHSGYSQLDGEITSYLKKNYGA